VGTLSGHPLPGSERPKVSSSPPGAFDPVLVQAVLQAGFQVSIGHPEQAPPPQRESRLAAVSEQREFAGLVTRPAVSAGQAGTPPRRAKWHAAWQGVAWGDAGC
jgi:hypothetical protein